MMFVFLQTSLRLIVCSSPHLPVNFMISLLTAEKYSTVCTYYNFIINLSVDGHLGLFQLLAIMKWAAMNVFL